MATRRITVEAQFVDQTQAGLSDLQRRLATLEQRLAATGAAADKAGKQVSQGIVSERVGKGLTAFNEKSERARSLMVVFGGAIGGAAGEVVFLAGSIGAVVGGFTALQLAAAATIGAVAALGIGIRKSINFEADRAREKLDGLTDSAKTLTDRLKAENEQLQKQILGAEIFEQKRRERLRQELKTSEDEALRAVRRITSFRLRAFGEFGGFGLGIATIMGESLDDAKKRLSDARKALSDFNIELEDNTRLKKASQAAGTAETTTKPTRQGKTKAQQTAEQNRRDAQRDAQASLDRIAAEDLAIKKIQEKAAIEKMIRESDLTATEAQMTRAMALLEVEDDRVARAQLMADLDKATFEDEQARKEAEVALEQSFQDTLSRIAREGIEQRKKERKEDNDQQKKDNALRNRAFQLGAGQLIGFIQAAEEGRLKSLAVSSAWQAVQQWAYYFGARAFDLTGQAENHLISALTHTAFAASAGIGSLFQGGGGGSQGAGTSISQARSTGGVQAQDQQPEQNIVYIGNFFESEDANRELAARVAAANQRESFVGV